MAMKLLGRTGPVAGRDAIISDLLRLGAAADSDFRITAGGVSRHHARILKVNDAYWVEDAGSTNGTFLNGQRIVRERLQHLDVITLGREVDLIVVSREGIEAPATKAVVDAWLEWLDGREGAPRVDLPLGELTIGRLAPSNVIIESPVVSQLHVRIQRTADRVIVQDLGSVNGTFVNGQRITAVTVLANGDTLSIAGVRRFRSHVVGAGGSVPREDVSPSTIVFDQEWKTKLVWSADELAQLETERQKVLETARRLQESPAAAPAAAKPKAAPAAAKASAAAANAPAAAPPAPAAASPAPPQPVAAVRPAPPKPPSVAATPAVATPPAATPAAATPAVATPAAAPPAPPRAKPPIDAPTRPIAAPLPATPPPLAAKVSGVRLTGTAGTFSLDKGRHIVGRSVGIGVSVLDPNVSRNHAILAIEENGATVEDTKSANGTLLNGAPIQGAPVPLKSGDRITFGTVEFKVELIS